MQLQGSSQVSPQSALDGAEAAVCFAGVAQLVEHLFCKQVVRGSSPRASSGLLANPGTKPSESCPSGQREQAVNLPAYAYAGSNPALSTEAGLRPASVSISCRGELSSPSAEVNSAEPPPQVFGSLPKNTRGGRSGKAIGTFPGLRREAKRAGVGSTNLVRHLAGVAQLVERQPSKLNVESSSLFSRSAFRAPMARNAHLSCVGSAPAPAEVNSAGPHPRFWGPSPKTIRVLGARRSSHENVTSNAHLAQLVEHVLGKDEVTSSILVVGSKQK
jgi:hypothetical protein